MKLWGSEIQIGNIYKALYEVQYRYNLKTSEMIEGYTKNLENRANGCVINVFRKPLEEFKENGKMTTQILQSYNIEFNPNWEMFNQTHVSFFQTLEKLYFQFIKMADSGDLSQEIYDKTFSSTMAKLTAPKYGVTEGIITSIPSNYYMYMGNVKREYLKKEQQAHDIAQRAVANWQNQYFKEAEERDIEIFVKHFFPMLVQAISVYFSVAFEFVLEGLELSINDYNDVFNKDASEKLLEEPLSKEKIINSLKLFPYNGKVWLLCVKNGYFDKEFMEYCRECDSDVFRESIKEEIIKELKDIAHKDALYNRNVINDKSLLIIDAAKKYYTFMEKNLKDSISWKAILTEVYKSQLDAAYDKFRELINKYRNVYGVVKRIGEKDAEKELHEAVIDADWDSIYNLAQTLGDISTLELFEGCTVEEWKIKQINKIDDQILLAEKQIEQERIFLKNQEKQRKELEEKRTQLEKERMDLLEEYNAIGFALFGEKVKKKKALQVRMDRLSEMIRKMYN